MNNRLDVKTITTTNIKKTDHRDGSVFLVTCPKCKKEIEVITWDPPVCECGYTWTIKLIAVGKK